MLFRSADDTGAVLKYAQKTWGFMTLTVDKDTISGETLEVDRNGHVAATRDTFSYPAGPITLSNPKSVPTL